MQRLGRHRYPSEFLDTWNASLQRAIHPWGSLARILCVSFGGLAHWSRLCLSMCFVSLGKSTLSRGFLVVAQVFGLLFKQRLGRHRHLPRSLVAFWTLVCLTRATQWSTSCGRAVRASQWSTGGSCPAEVFCKRCLTVLVRRGGDLVPPDWCCLGDLARVASRRAGDFARLAGGRL